MSGEVVAMLIVAVVHIAGLALLIGMLFEREERGFLRGWWPSDEAPEGPDAPGPRAPDGGLPLPDALPARVRARGPLPLGGLGAPPARRPVHVPAREPVGEPAGGRE